MVYESLVNQDIATKLEFTSDNTQKEVAVTAPNGNPFENAGAAILFENDDNWELISIQPILPHNYSKGTGTPSIGIVYRSEDDLTTITPPEIPVGIIKLPDLVTEYVFPHPKPIFMNPPDPPLTAKWKILINSISINISMIEAPDELQNDTFKINFLLKIKHNLSMS